MYGGNTYAWVCKHAYAWACKLGRSTTGGTTFLFTDGVFTARGGYATDAGCFELWPFFKDKAYIHYFLYSTFELFNYYYSKKGGPKRSPRKSTATSRAT